MDKKQWTSNIILKRVFVVFMVLCFSVQMVYAEETGPVSSDTPVVMKEEMTTHESVEEETDEEVEVKAEANSEPISEPETKPENLIYEDDTCNVSVSYDEAFPSDAVLSVEEIDESNDEYQSYLDEIRDITGADIFSYVKLYDVSIIDKDNAKKHYQPDNEVFVTMEHTEFMGDTDYRVIHFGKKAEELTATNEEGTVLFTTNGFSAYAIVEVGDGFSDNLIPVTDISELTDGGLYVAHVDGYFFTNEQYNVNATRTGILKSAQNANPISSASQYFFEDAGDGKWYAYTLDGTQKKYVSNNSNNSLYFSNTPVTAFTIEKNDQNQFFIRNGSWYWNMQGGANGKGFCSYNVANDPNSRLFIFKYDDTEEDPIGLDGKTYGLMRYDGATTGKAVTAEQDGNSLKAEQMLVLTNVSNHKDVLFVPKGSDIVKWSFEWYSGMLYYVSTEIDGVRKYLVIGEDGPSVSDEPSLVSITPGDNENKGKMVIAGEKTLTYSGHLATGFISGDLTTNSWLCLVEESELTSDYQEKYEADKVSVSDLEKVHNGSQVVIYTRVWNNEDKVYDFYAIDDEGNLVKCTDIGDAIEWKGDSENHFLWEFTEYYYEGTENPNYYYELQNVYSGKYIAPQASSGQVLSDNKIGVNLEGRRFGDYFTSILAWDNDLYAYTGLGVNDDKELVSVPIKNVGDFYFAIMDDLEDDDSLKTVETIDHTKCGITMKMSNWNTSYHPASGTNTSKEQYDVIGESSGGMGTTLTQGLLSTNLVDGYPVATITGKSLSELFGGGVPANHLFLANEYNETGYFIYDSTENFAHFDGENFVVYENLGTSDLGGNKPSIKHGQFFPYNDLTPGVYAKNNPENLYTAMQEELPDSNPRKYERLYETGKPDYYFGMELEATFVQTPSGLDAWGHDIIYEFTGDDDFWLYVDGELVMDLGGIHSAVAGSVNYSTGDVVVNGVHTTLYNIFRENYSNRYSDLSDEEVESYLSDIFEYEDGHYLFKDHTTHTMKVFFMERGGGASNLKMKFNLSTAKYGDVTLSKEISGTDKADFMTVKFPYQIFYRNEGEEDWTRLTQRLVELPDGHNWAVSYKNSSDRVDYDEEKVIDGVRYQDVFYLKPGESADIHLISDEVEYYIKEVGVDINDYDRVYINQEEVSGTSPDAAAIEDADAAASVKEFGTTPVRVEQRKNVIYTNHVVENRLKTLSVTKHLYKEDYDGTRTSAHELSYPTSTPIDWSTQDNTIFRYRVYIADEAPGEDDDIRNYYYRFGNYYVKNPAGHYCIYEPGQGFVPLGKTNFNALTEEDLDRATFVTGLSGTIERIPAGYTIEIRNLLAGTWFRVDEENIPEGYVKLPNTEDTNDIDGYEREGGGFIEGKLPNEGVITKADADPHLLVNNKRDYDPTIHVIPTGVGMKSYFGLILILLFSIILTIRQRYVVEGHNKR